MSVSFNSGVSNGIILGKKAFFSWESRQGPGQQKIIFRCNPQFLKKNWMQELELRRFNLSLIFAHLRDNDKTLVFGW